MDDVLVWRGEQRVQGPPDLCGRTSTTCSPHWLASSPYNRGMPIYEYRCEDCGTKFEKLIRRSSDQPECPSCGQKHLAQEHSTFAAHAGGGSKSADMPVCPSGRCSNPGMCGMN
jgi:putative FmdB family regulatory protein